MTERKAATAAFLAQAGWEGSASSLLAGDASARRYLRLSHRDETAVLMDAPPAAAAETRAFIRIAGHLAGLGYSPPRILAAAPEAGLVLLEDLGDAHLACMAAADPDTEAVLYAAATDFLADLHRHAPPPALPLLDPPKLAELALLALDCWRGAFAAPLPVAEAEAFRAALEDTFVRLAPETPVLVLRDFHGENLLWLPQRHGHARLGLLDFQDAMQGHAGYDLISLLDDARRDMPPDLRAGLLRRYIAATGQEAARFTAAAAALAVARHLRILGIFTRLCLRDGKPQYLAHLSRVWGQLQHALAHPELAGLARICHDLLPAPTPQRLQTLRERCARKP